MGENEYVTLGRSSHPGYTVRLWLQPQETLCTASVVDRFRMVFLSKGAGVLRLDERRLTVMAPAVLCLNERESAAWEEQREIHAQALYFHPGVIHEKFDFQNIRGLNRDFSATEEHDRYYLHPFVDRDACKPPLYALAPGSVQRLDEAFRCIRTGLVDQPDDTWPCRTRSYFLEALFLVRRLCDHPDDAGVMELTASPAADVAPVLVYLHTHYPERITLEALCRSFHTNRTTLSRRFREATGASVVEYLIRLRVRLASSILRNTHLPVNEVMARVGFSDGAHFNRIFKRHVGHSPSEYRARFNWMR